MKVYVGNLPFSVNSEALKKAFSEYGAIEEATVIEDKFSNRSKGFGFVTFSNDEEAKKAISDMNGKEFSGRNLTVSEAKPMSESDRPRRSGGNGSFGGRNSQGNRKGFGGNRSRGSGNRSFGSRDSGRRR